MSPSTRSTSRVRTAALGYRGADRCSWAQPSFPGVAWGPGCAGPTCARVGAPALLHRRGRRCRGDRCETLPACILCCALPCSRNPDRRLQPRGGHAQPAALAALCHPGGSGGLCAGAVHHLWGWQVGMLRRGAALGSRPLGVGGRRQPVGRYLRVVRCFSRVTHSYRWLCQPHLRAPSVPPHACVSPSLLPCLPPPCLQRRPQGRLRHPHVYRQRGHGGQLPCQRGWRPPHCAAAGGQPAAVALLQLTLLHGAFSAPHAWTWLAAVALAVTLLGHVLRYPAARAGVPTPALHAHSSALWYTPPPLPPVCSGWAADNDGVWAHARGARRDLCAAARHALQVWPSAARVAALGRAGRAPGSCRLMPLMCPSVASVPQLALAWPS